MWYYEKEDRQISLAQIKKMLEPSTIPKTPGLKDFESREIYWAEYDVKPELSANEKAIPGEFYKDGKEYKRRWVVESIHKDIESAKRAKLNEINSWYKSEMDKISAGLSQHEINTFYRQDLEAQALSGASNASAPFVRIQAENRGVNPLILSQKIQSKAKIFNDASAKALGNKQRLEDLIDASETIEAVFSVVVDYPAQ